MNRVTFERYAQLKLQIKRLEAECDFLKPEILAQTKEILQDKDAKIELKGIGFFTIKTRTTYQYSNAVQELEKQLKEAKKKEEQSGAAVIKTEVEYPEFKELKNAEA